MNVGRLIFLTVFALIFTAGSAIAGNERWGWGGDQPDRRVVLIGEIDGRYSVIMELGFTDHSVSGRYAYTAIGEPLNLRGERDPDADDLCLLEEFSHEGVGENHSRELTGRWSIRADERGQTWTGTWTSPDGERAYDVELTRVAEYDLMSRTIHGGTGASRAPRLIGQHPALAAAVDALADEGVEEVGSFLDEVRGYTASPVEEGYFERYHYYFARDCFIDYLDEQLVSMHLMGYEFTGGAHGNYWYHAQNYVIRDGEAVPFGLGDLFLNNSDWVATLRPLIVAGLHEAEAEWIPEPGDEDYDDILSADWFSAFTVAPHGLTFYFGPYIYGSFARGTIVVRIGWGGLAEVIDPEGPAGRWVE